MSIYLTRRDKLQGGLTLDPVTLWKYNVKARLRLEFCFHGITGNIDVFEQQWAHEELLCRVTSRELKLLKRSPEYWATQIPRQQVLCGSSVNI